VFICPSRFLAEKLTRAGVYPDRLHVLNHFVDVAAVAPKTEPGGPVVYAGRLSPREGRRRHHRGHGQAQWRPAGRGR
jgi:hypothetical protein